MGFDPVTLGAANKRAEQTFTAPGHFAILSSRLVKDQEDAVLLVLGDSTGDESSWEWVGLVTDWLAEKFPAYTVKYYAWSDGSQAYGSATTVQTGTGTHTLHVYNGSVSGAGATYPTTRLGAMAPTTPHVVVTSFGHNDGSTGSVYRATHYTLMRQLEDRFPKAGIISIAQNPTAPDYSGHVNGMQRVQAVIDLAASEGYGLIDVCSAFLRDPDYVDNLLNPDGLHPSAAGQRLWARTVQRHIQQSLMIQPLLATRKPHRVWVPASAFVAVEGTPAYGLQGATGVHFEGWAFDQSTQEGILATVDFPDWWQSVNYYLIWSWQSASGYTGANNIARWEISVGRFGGMTAAFDSPSTNKNISASGYNPLATVNAGASNGGAYGNSLVRMFSNFEAAGRPQMIRIRRRAADGEDTLAEDAYFRGVFIERAS